MLPSLVNVNAEVKPVFHESQECLQILHDFSKVACLFLPKIWKIARPNLVVISQDFRCPTNLSAANGLMGAVRVNSYRFDGIGTYTISTMELFKLG